MPNKRDTQGLNACTDYSLRVCGESPCEYHRTIDAAKKRGITLTAYLQFLEATADENRTETRN